MTSGSQLPAGVEPWDPADEDGLAPSECVSLAQTLQAGFKIELETNEYGFVATIDGRKWDPYGILSELLEDLSELYADKEVAS